MKGRLLALAAWVITATVQAAPFQTMDPRTLGMGGAAVAGATSAAAAFYNPALLANARKEEDFALELPVAAVEINDPSGLQDEIRAFDDNDYISNYAQAIADFNQVLSDPGATPSQVLAARDRVVNSGYALLDGLNALSGKPLLLQANAAALLGIPSRRFAVSLYANGWGGGSVAGIMSQADYQAAKSTLDDAAAVDPNDPATWISAALTDPTPDFTSALRGRFLQVNEVGLALARRLELFGGLAVGVTPKWQQVTAYEFNYVASALDQAELDPFRDGRSYGDFNLDVGLARSLNELWRVGLSVKNLLPRRYETNLGTAIELDPQWRLGVARAGRWLSWTVDLDLSENAPYALGDPSRMLALGGEWNAWNVMLLRLGYRTDLAGSLGDILTAGLGFNLLGLHVEAGVGVGTEDFQSFDTLAASAQLGFRF